MRIAVVTGASSGLGRELVQLLDTEGLDEIWVNARRSCRLEALRTQVQTPLRCIPGDISQDSTTGALAQALEEVQPVVAYVICSAGFGKIGSAGDISLSDTRKMIQVNCEAAVAVTSLCLPYMTAGGRIAEICSVAAFLPIPYLNVYASTKAFLYHYSRALAEELAPRRISVTAVCPYWIADTEFISLAKQSDQSGHFRHFFLADHTAAVARQAWQDIQHGAAVSTPGHIAPLIRLAAAVLPVRLVMWGSRLFR